MRCDDHDREEHMRLNTYDLGKWHPELGPYRDWEERKLAEFCKDYVVVDIDQCSLPTGGMLLLVNGHPKEKTDATSQNV